DAIAEGSCANSFVITRTWTFTDACGNSSSTTQTINVIDDVAPVIAVPPTRLSINCPEIPVFGEATATDVCDTSVTLTFADVRIDGACAGSYSLTRTWTATDACGNSSTAYQTIRVKDISAPVFDALPETTTINCPATPEFTQATATDACGSAVTLTSTDVTTNGACEGSYSVTRTWTATDACGNAATSSQTINVQDTTAPTFVEAVPESVTVECNAIPEATTLTATDNCGTASVTYAEVKTNNSESCPNSYVLTRTWTATDACGNAATASQTINVQDTTAPTTTTSFEPSIDVKCDAIPLKPELVFVDECSSVSTPIYTEKIINQTADSYSIVREWNVSDSCGNSSKFVQVVNVSINNTVITVTSTACNLDPSTIDLNNLLPSDTSTNGTWIDKNNSGALQGSNFSPFGVAVGDYVFEYKINGEDCPLSILINMNVNSDNDCGGIVLSCGVVKVHNAFSPNGDNINRLFIIDNIEDTICYPENTVEIYNRWGVLVFETKNYDNVNNVFDGTSKGRTTIGQSSGLPTGTYYYILNYTSYDGNNNIQTNRKDGFLYLTR
ncbi:MAG: gliding motility-associated C-terminal domain-containing protein, partial [Flavobacterium sp.]|uniref:gliding motility-associated C-terminal domain-containing protein n=1 Tax=Flavobacterium sp. TaxID=239 RepID=UPI002620F34C